MRFCRQIGMNVTTRGIKQDPSSPYRQCLIVCKSKEANRTASISHITEGTQFKISHVKTELGILDSKTATEQASL